MGVVHKGCHVFSFLYEMRTTISFQGRPILIVLQIEAFHAQLCKVVFLEDAPFILDLRSGRL